MTELEMRELVADTALEYLGCNEYDGSHRPIIDLYNKIKPLPRGYKMTYSDPWCAAFVSAVGEDCGMGDIILPECACDPMINLYKAKGLWKEEDNYNPKVGDLVMYDWGDSGAGDNMGSADHVGIVYAKNGDTLTIIEGNISDSVDFRTLKVNGRYIRGYCCPDYAGSAGSVSSAEATEDKEPTEVINASPERTASVKLPILFNGDIGVAVGAMQSLIMYHGYSVGVDGADCDFGNNTDRGLRQFQRDMGLSIDGVCGVDTWSKLLGI